MVNQRAQFTVLRGFSYYVQKCTTDDTFSRILNFNSESLCIFRNLIEFTHYQVVFGVNLYQKCRPGGKSLTSHNQLIGAEECIKNYWALKLNRTSHSLNPMFLFPKHIHQSTDFSFVVNSSGGTTEELPTQIWCRSKLEKRKVEEAEKNARPHGTLQRKA